MGRLFGTDGVRGVANSELTPDLAFKLGKAGGHVLSKDHGRPVFLIGKDTRLLIWVPEFKSRWAHHKFDFF